MARSSLLVTLFVAIVAYTSAFTVVAPTIHRQVCLKSDTELAVKIKVSVGDGEPIESALRRFKREVNKSGHLMELRHKRYFENPQQRAIRKVKEGRLRKKFERMAKRRQRSQV